MASVSLTVRRSDLFPVGTLVGAYPKYARIFGGQPSGTPLATATVAADGSLTFPGLNEREALVLWAEVGGEHRYLGSEAPAPVAAPETLKQRIAKRRALVGA